MAQGQLYEAQYSEVLSPALGSEEALAVLKGMWLERCPAEKGLGLLVNSS